MAPKRKLTFAQSEALGKAQAQKRANDRDRWARQEAARQAAQEAARKAAEPCWHGWRNWEYDFDASPPMERRSCRHCGLTEERELKW